MKVATILLALIPAIMATTIPADAQEAEAHRAARELMAEKGQSLSPRSWGSPCDTYEETKECLDECEVDLQIEFRRRDYKTATVVDKARAWLFCSNSCKTMCFPHIEIVLDNPGRPRKHYWSRFKALFHPEPDHRSLSGRSDVTIAPPVSEKKPLPIPRPHLDARGACPDIFRKECHWDCQSKLREQWQMKKFKDVNAGAKGIALEKCYECCNETCDVCLYRRRKMRLGSDSDSDSSDEE